eukprot:TRINITY_DN902_c0_g1_i2.p1 TRINITY_DN902_c0_g1~~TRINITY_DN902_c0_g1_i2.p1  ORF type:complete len:621 (+),score=108.46 TRINITY_DN902_c0_g1_i2:85-1947(+)
MSQNGINKASSPKPTREVSTDNNTTELQGNYIPPQLRKKYITEHNNYAANNDRSQSSQPSPKPNGHVDRRTNPLSLSGSPRMSKWRDDHSEQSSNGLLRANSRLEKELFGDRDTDQPKQGINFDSYQKMDVDVSGISPPKPITSFEDINLGPVILNNVKLAGYEQPTPVQQHSIPIVMQGRDLMACAQTGSGKTAAFLFPTIAKLCSGPQRAYNSDRARMVCPTFLVLAPTRELASQIHKEARKFAYRSKLRSVVVYGGADIGYQFRELEKGCDILVATPGRLVDILERKKVSLGEVAHLCIDEADRMLDMGFEKQIRRIVEEENMPPVKQRQTMLFSATFPKEIQKLAQDFLHDYIYLRIGRMGTTDFITQHIKHVEEHQKKDFLLKTIQTVQGLTLIFVETKRSADNLEHWLYNEGYAVASIHGDRSQRERESALASFRGGQTPILVATDVAARGLDIPNVVHVINFDLPNDVDDYIHRIGRTGRAGHPGIATSFFSDKNRNISRELVNLLMQTDQEIPDWLQEASVQSSKYNTTPRGRRGGRGRGSRGGRGNFSYGNFYSGNYGGNNYGGNYDTSSNGNWSGNNFGGPGDVRREKQSRRDNTYREETRESGDTWWNE